MIQSQSRVISPSGRLLGLQGLALYPTRLDWYPSGRTKTQDTSALPAVTFWRE